MLVQFSVKNFRSFKEEATLSMVAASIKEKEARENLFKVTDKLSLLKSAVIYGANASGKSNLFDAMRFMRQFIQDSSKETQSTEKIKVSRFRLSTETDDVPASFEIIFIHEGIQYRYGFAVDEERVHAEWLFYVPNKQEVKVFTRAKQQFNLTGHFKSEEYIINRERVSVRPNALLLSVSSQFNGKMANKIMKWVSSFNCISGLQPGENAGVTLSLMEEEKGMKAILEFLKDADTGIADLKIFKNKIPIDDLPSHMQKFLTDRPKTDIVNVVDIKTYHLKYDSKGEVVDRIPFSMHNDESAGTKKFFELSGAFIDTLKQGKVLMIDEFASRLHPRLVKAICELFNSREKNPRNAQLIFASHNTNILRKDIFRRDQVWFIEKDRFGASELYSLVEYKQKDGKKVRNDASYEKDYLMGRYGGVPCIGDFEVPYGD